MKENTSNDKDYEALNAPENYSLNVPYLLYDKNGETIITRTAKGINRGDINPFETNMMEVTLYLTNFVKELLELIDTDLLADVAQAINDEESRHATEDGQITHVSSEYYGTGQGLCFCYSWYMDNWNNGGESVDAMEIADLISERRNKVETYRKKIAQRKKKLKEQETSNSYVLSGWSEKSSSYQVYEEQLQKIKQLQEQIDILSINNATQKKENEGLVISYKKYIDKLRDENERLVKQQEEMQHARSGVVTYEEHAFNAQTKLPCFTNRQMGIFLLAISGLTEDPVPAKTTLGEVVEKIAGYKAKTVNQNMKGIFRNSDKETVAKAIECRLPKLAAKVRRL